MDYHIHFKTSTEKRVVYNIVKYNLKPEPHRGSKEKKR